MMQPHYMVQVDWQENGVYASLLLTFTDIKQANEFYNTGVLDLPPGTTKKKLYDEEKILQRNRATQDRRVDTCRS